MVSLLSAEYRHRLEERVRRVANDAEAGLLSLAQRIQRETDVPAALWVGEADVLLRDVRERVEMLHDVCTLYLPKKTASLVPRLVLYSVLGQRVDDGAWDTCCTETVEGDVHKVTVCLRLLHRQAHVPHPGEINFLLVSEQDVPVLYVRGIHSHVLHIPWLGAMDFEEFSERWAVACGALAVREADGIRLPFYGEEQSNLALEGLEVLLEAMEEVLRALRAWRGAIGVYEEGYGNDAECRRMYQSAVHKALMGVEALERRAAALFR